MRHHPRHGRRDQADATNAAEWFAGRLPTDWFDGDPAVVADREEITVIGKLPAEDSESSARASGRVARFREDTRAERMRIADEAQSRYDRKVSWGLEVDTPEGVERILFTHIAVPVMTRLKQPERQVLDTLVDAGVARSRSDALAWSVKLVGEHTEEWLGKLRDAMTEVDELRTQGPDL
ncbi:transcriptional regulator AbmR [soil metagenome]